MEKTDLAMMSSLPLLYATLATLSGEPVTLSSLLQDGRPLVLVFLRHLG